MGRCSTFRVFQDQIHISITMRVTDFENLFPVPKPNQPLRVYPSPCDYEPPRLAELEAAYHPPLTRMDYLVDTEDISEDDYINAPVQPMDLSGRWPDPQMDSPRSPSTSSSSLTKLCDVLPWLFYNKVYNWTYWHFDQELKRSTLNQETGGRIFFLLLCSFDIN